MRFSLLVLLSSFFSSFPPRERTSESAKTTWWVSGSRGLASLPCLRRADSSTRESRLPPLSVADALFACQLRDIAACRGSEGPDTAFGLNPVSSSSLGFYLVSLVRRGILYAPPPTGTRNKEMGNTLLTFCPPRLPPPRTAPCPRFLHLPPPTRTHARHWWRDEYRVSPSDLGSQSR
jgi:hypothetical protein